MILSALLLFAQTTATMPPVVSRARIDGNEGVSIRTAVVPETVVVGQQALYQVAVFVSDEVRMRLRRNPEFVPPELRALLAYDPSGSYAMYKNVIINRRAYEVHVFQRAVFPLRAGTHTIPPARLTYGLPLSSSFFSREETYSLKSDSARLIARDPPTEGRPDDWTGAVGSLALGLRTDLRGVRVGDPVTVTVQVRGDGNVNLLPRPTLSVPWGSVVNGPERVTLDSALLRVRGTKEFDFVVTPSRAGRVEIAVARYPYFDPATGRYEVALAATESLTITPAGAAAAAVPAAAEEDSTGSVALRTRWIGPPGIPWRRHGIFWALLALAPLPTVVVLWRRRKHSPVVADASAASLPAASYPAAPPPREEAALHETLRRALSSVATIPDAGTADDVERGLRLAGVTEATACEAAVLDAALASKRYGPNPATTAERVALESRVREVAGKVTREAAPPSTRRRSGARALILFVSFVAASSSAFALEGADAAFARGLAAMTAKDIPAAARAFAEAARQAPQAAEAWFNLGTTAWLRRDTATAAAAWQRAARLDPMASDVRDRLSLLPGGEPPIWAASAVPPVSPELLALLAAAAWLAGWGIAARAVSRRTRGFLPVALTVGGLLLGGASVVADRRLAGDDLVVLRVGQRLRALPALGAEPVANVATGEAATRIEIAGDWVRLRADDGREGWVEGRDALSIARP